MNIKLLLLILTILGISFSCEPLCENEEIKSIISPDGRYKAIAFLRNCGATASFSPQVSIMGIEKKITNRPGNIFRGNKSRFIDIYWESQNLLVIEHICEVRDIFLNENQIYDISIQNRIKNTN